MSDDDRTWAALLDRAGAAATGVRFPAAARRRIIEVLASGSAGSAPVAAAAVVAGHFYRDHNADESFSPGEEFPGAVLGTPRLNATALHAYFNCFWSDRLVPGAAATLVFEPAGAARFETTVELQPGLNLVHIPVAPTRPTIYVIPHSHFDTEWRYTYEEYLEQELPNLRSRFDLMEREPSHCFSFDEECVTRPFMERSDAVYQALLRHGVRDGMVEPKGLVTQQELTMPYGESLVRCITMGERMLSALLGEPIRPQVYWCVDHYGMGVQMAQILRKAGRRYFLIGEYNAERIPYTEPALTAHQEFWLRSPDGSTVLSNRGFYGGGAKPTAIPPRGPHQSGFQFQGEDNCPPRPELGAEVRALNDAQDEYTYVISTSLPFFRAIEGDAELPTFETESFTTRWCGIYESRLQSKTQNRALENRILALEALATCARLEGLPYPEALEEAWYLLLLNQHHDPLMSVMARVGLFQSEIPARFRQCCELLDAAGKEVASWLGTAIDTSGQAGTPLIVYNPLPTARTAVLEVEIGAAGVTTVKRDSRSPGDRAANLEVGGGTEKPATGADRPAEEGSSGADGPGNDEPASGADRPTAEDSPADAAEAGGPQDWALIDPRGREVPSQPLEPVAGTRGIAFLAAALPALGWRTYYAVDRGQRADLAAGGIATGPGAASETGAAGVSATTTRMENEQLSVELADGMIRKVVEKRSGTVVLNAAPERGVGEVLIWRDEGCISIIRPLDDNGVVDFLHNDGATLLARSAAPNERTVSVLEAGPLRARLRIRFELDWGRFEQQLELEAGSRLLRVSTDIRWNPAGRIAPFDGRRVRLAFATAFTDAGVACDTPFGVIPWKQLEQIRPVTSWLAAESSSGGVALFHQGTHSVQVVDDVIYATLLRSVLEPEFDPEDGRACKWDAANDEAAEAGTHHLEHGLYIYPGSWSDADVPAAARAFNCGIEVVAAAQGAAGSLAPELSYLEIDPPTLVTAAIKTSEYRAGGTVVRLYNPTDSRVRGRVTIGFDHGAVEVVDFREQIVDTLTGANPYPLEVQPFEIVTLCIAPP